MPSSQRVYALVLFRKNIGESDRLVTFLTKEHGIIRAIAKGVRKIPSSRGGHVEPFTLVHVVLQESRAGVYVQGVETEEYFQDFHADSDAVSRMRRVVYASTKLFDSGEALPALFDMFVFSLKNISRLSTEKRRLVESALYLQCMGMAGVLPDFRSCIECGTARPEDAVVVASREGVWRCLSCQPTLHDAVHSLSVRQFAVLRYIISKPHHAQRIALHDEDALHVERAVHTLIAHAIEDSARQYAAVVY